MATKAQLEMQLSQLRNEEATKRAIFVETLESLSNAAARAAHKIDSREWEDGLACIGRDIVLMNEAQDELETLIDEIKWVHRSLNQMTAKEIDALTSSAQRETAKLSTDDMISIAVETAIHMDRAPLTLQQLRNETEASRCIECSCTNYQHYEGCRSR